MSAAGGSRHNGPIGGFGFCIADLRADIALKKLRLLNVDELNQRPRAESSIPVFLLSSSGRKGALCGLLREMGKQAQKRDVFDSALFSAPWKGMPARIADS
jgi:hypothetical protein